MMTFSTLINSVKEFMNRSTNRRKYCNTNITLYLSGSMLYIRYIRSGTPQRPKVQLQQTINSIKINKRKKIWCRVANMRAVSKSLLTNNWPLKSDHLVIDWSLGQQNTVKKSLIQGLLVQS